MLISYNYIMDKLILKISKLCVYFNQNEDMSNHTTFRCGGTARFYGEVDNIKSLVKIIKLVKNKLPLFILGNGSNTLFLNYNGLVICTRKLNKLKVHKNMVYAESGVNLFTLNLTLKQNGLSGAEFSFGIPATVGGACYNNAGAYGGQFGDLVEKVIVYDTKCHIIKRKDLKFSYRNSSLKQNNQIILGVVLKFEKSSCESIDEKMKTYYRKRLDTQPNLPSAGSVFKRDEDIIPAKIIDNMGLKGVKINGAVISDKHAGFIVNNGNASPEDIIKLIELIKQKVKTQHGIELKQEIQIIGD